MDNDGKIVILLDIVYTDEAGDEGGVGECVSGFGGEVSKRRKGGGLEARVEDGEDIVQRRVGHLVAFR